MEILELAPESSGVNCQGAGCGEDNKDVGVKTLFVLPLLVKDVDA